jgi:RNA polymerase sigma factor (sigma-70 family)
MTDLKQPPAGADLTWLVAAAARGDEAAWNAITDRFSRLVWSVARSYRLPQDDAADAVQNTWLRLLENLGRIENPQALPGWLTTTARHEALGVIRRRGRDIVSRDDDLGVGRPDPLADELDAALLDDEQDAALWRCFRRLTERCQRLLRVLMAADRPAYTEVAAGLGMPIGSIGPTRMRCLAQLRTLVADSGYPFAEAY